VTKKEFIMKRLNKVLLIASLSLSSLPACAGHKDHEYDYARVISARPVYETFRYPLDEQVCWVEQSRRAPHHTAAALVLGGVIGGALGNQFGDGHSRTAATVAGLALGGAIAYGVSHKHQPGPRYPGTRKRCEIQRSWRSETRIAAWDVTYKYHGNLYHTRTAEQPGKKIRVPGRW
jgi:uncharacterized protein YcfJ